MRGVVRAGRAREGRTGRSRAAAVLKSQQSSYLQLLLEAQSCIQFHTYSASCQAGCHCEMRGDDVERFVEVLEG